MIILSAYDVTFKPADHISRNMVCGVVIARFIGSPRNIIPVLLRPRHLTTIDRVGLKNGLLYLDLIQQEAFTTRGWVLMITHRD
jgi:hypothetical protein